MPDLKEGYFANVKNYSRDDMPIVVTRYYPRWLGSGYRFHPELSPSKKLLADWKKGKIDWEQYEVRFRREMEAGKGKMMIDNLAWESQYETIRLLCYEKEPPCHRFILIDLINESLNEHNACYAEYPSKNGKEE